MRQPVCKPTYSKNEDHKMSQQKRYSIKARQGGKFLIPNITINMSHVPDMVITKLYNC
jgi:hypothetical protein